MADAVARSCQAVAQHAAEVETANRKLIMEVVERQQAERLAILHDIDRAILAAHSSAVIAETTLRHLRRLVRAPRAVLALCDVTAGEATSLPVDVEGHTELQPGVRFPPEGVEDLTGPRRGEVQVLEASP